MYTPTTNQTDTEIELFYKEISIAMNKTIKCGDFTSKVGLSTNETEIAMGNYETPRRKDRGDVLLQYLLKQMDMTKSQWYNP